LDPQSPSPTDETAVPESPPAPETPTPPAASPEESTVGTGSVIGLGCTIFVLIFVCIGVAIFMWRQVN
jgi:hypothetical protein